MTTAEVVELIKDFTDKDGNRPTVATPWLDKGLIKASEGHILILVPEALCPGHSIEPRSNAPDTDKLNLFEDRSFIVLDIEALKQAIADRADVAEEATKNPCRRCHGTGRVGCSHCDNGDIECEDCDGTGLISHNRLGQPMNSNLSPVPLFDRRFNYHSLKLLDRAVTLFEGRWKVSLGKLADGASRSFYPALFTNDAGVTIAIAEMGQE